MVDRTKQPGGCIRISEKCVFTLKSLLSRYGKQLKWVYWSNYSFTSTLFDLINFQKTNTIRAGGESRAEVFSLKKNQEK